MGVVLWVYACVCGGVQVGRRVRRMQWASGLAAWPVGRAYLPTASLPACCRGPPQLNSTATASTAAIATLPCCCSAFLQGNPDDPNDPGTVLGGFVG